MATRIPNTRPWPFTAAALLMVLFITGCPPRPAVMHRPDVMPTAAELIQEYNARVARIDQLWSRALVAMEWRDANGRKHYEQGDSSQIAIRLPDRVALEVGKVGMRAAWLGCDGQRFWFFDFMSDPKKAFVGSHESFQPDDPRLPVPLPPRDLLQLLGITPLPQPAPDTAVGWDSSGCFVIQPPGMAMRLCLDFATKLPRKIELLDSQGQTRVAASLYDYGDMQLQGVAPGGWPSVAKRLEITVPDQKGYVRLRLTSGLSDGKANDRVKDDAFDFEALAAAFKPQEIISLDSHTPPP